MKLYKIVVKESFELGTEYPDLNDALSGNLFNSIEISKEFNRGDVFYKIADNTNYKSRLGQVWTITDNKTYYNVYARFFRYSESKSGILARTNY